MFEFVNVELDKWEFKYTNLKDEQVVIPFTRTIEIAKTLEGIIPNARMKMFKDLTAQGLTKNDLIIEKVENGKKYFDETNYKMFEEKYIEEQSLISLNECFEKCFKKSLIEVVSDIKDLTEEKASKLSAEFTLIMVGKKAPSEENK